VAIILKGDLVTENVLQVSLQRFDAMLQSKRFVVRGLRLRFEAFEIGFRCRADDQLAVVVDVSDVDPKLPQEEVLGRIESMLESRDLGLVAPYHALWIPEIISFISSFLPRESSLKSP
jgi:hypothetical protein